MKHYKSRNAKIDKDGGIVVAIWEAAHALDAFVSHNAKSAFIVRVLDMKRFHIHTKCLYGFDREKVVFAIFEQIDGESNQWKIQPMISSKFLSKRFFSHVPFAIIIIVCWRWAISN